MASASIQAPARVMLLVTYLFTLLCLFAVLLWCGKVGYDINNFCTRVAAWVMVTGIAILTTAQMCFVCRSSNFKMSASNLSFAMAFKVVLPLAAVCVLDVHAMMGNMHWLPIVILDVLLPLHLAVSWFNANITKKGSMVLCVCVFLHVLVVLLLLLVNSISSLVSETDQSVGRFLRSLFQGMALVGSVLVVWDRSIPSAAWPDSDYRPIVPRSMSVPTLLGTMVAMLVLELCSLFARANWSLTTAPEPKPANETVAELLNVQGGADEQGRASPYDIVRDVRAFYLTLALFVMYLLMLVCWVVMDARGDRVLARLAMDPKQRSFNVLLFFFIFLLFVLDLIATIAALQTKHGFRALAQAVLNVLAYPTLLACWGLVLKTKLTDKQRFMAIFPLVFHFCMAVGLVVLYAVVERQTNAGEGYMRVLLLLRAMCEEVLILKLFVLAQKAVYCGAHDGDGDGAAAPATQPLLVGRSPSYVHSAPPPQRLH